MTIWRFPKVLVIHLKRFQNTFMRREKLNTPIEIPTNIDMRPYAPHSNHTSKGQAVYNLFGISHHSGSLYGGHYIADVKCGNGSWYRCNDHMISKIGAPDHN
mmetsp:Transcript_42585/g.40850  ORF Transcript_42585/g.40850 Transcript_42585/m.40850 type:complete len:102 (+) Transcript_42585:172-477(+)